MTFPDIFVAMANKKKSMTTNRDTVKQAYCQAYFLQGRQGPAMQITVRSFLGVKVRAQKQKRRSQYFSSQSSTQIVSDRLPNKISFSENQLLQLAVWHVSEYYERLEESKQFGTEPPEGPIVTFDPITEEVMSLFIALLEKTSEPALTEEDLMIRYLKHLALISVEQNPLHVAIAFNQFLFDYETRDTLLIYEGVDKHFGRGKEEAHLDQTRGEMWKKRLLTRFGDILETSKTKSGRNVFNSRPIDDWRKAFARLCLEKLTLWETTCSNGADETKPTEENRIHRLIHPSCRDQLLIETGFDPTTEQLLLPIFPGFSNRAGRTCKTQDRFNPPDLPDDAYRHLEKLFDHLTRRQRHGSNKQLIVKTDGIEVSMVELLIANSTKLSLPAGSRLIEIYSRETDGDLLLATCWLTEFDESEKRVIAETRAEGGQLVRFDIAFAEGGEAAVTISYRETKAIRWLSLEWRRLVYRFQELSFQPKPLTAWAMAGAAALALLFALWLWRQKPNELPTVVKQASPTVEPSPVTPPSPTAELPLMAENRPKPRSGSAIRNAEVSLGSVTRVFVQSFGEDEFSRNLREALIAKLRQSPLAVEDQILPATDAVLQTKPGANKQQVTLRLVNRVGKVLWQGSFKQRDSRQIAEQVVEKLVESIEAEKRKRP